MTDTEIVAYIYLDDQYKAGRLDLSRARQDLMMFYSLPPVRALEILNGWRKSYTQRHGKLMRKL